MNTKTHAHVAPGTRHHKPSEQACSGFLSRLKGAGVRIIREDEVAERLVESSFWRAAFKTLVLNGACIGIMFVVAEPLRGGVESLLSEYGVEASLAARMRAEDPDR